MSFANDYSESLHFDGNSGASITVNLNDAYYFDHILMATSQILTLNAASSLTIEVFGVSGGNTSSEFVIGANVKVMDYGHIDDGDNTKSMNRVTINGILEAWEWVNADFFVVNTGALFRTNYVSTGEGWWYGFIATPGTNIVPNGQIEYMGNGQAVANISYYDLLFSGDPGGPANVLKGSNLHVTHKIEINAPFNLSTNGILYFKGTTFINNTNFSSLTGTISNTDVDVYTEKTYSGTGSIEVGTFSNSSSQRIDVKLPISANTVIFDGTSNINNSLGSPFTVGIGSTDCSITLDGVATKNVGSFTAAPTFGTGALTLNYNKELTARTSGYEMPSSFAYLVIKNDKGVVLASDKTITGSANVFFTSPIAGMRGKPDLNGKVLHYTGTGTFFNGGTLLGTTGSTISFENSSTQTLSLSNSTSTLIDILKVDNTGLTVSQSGKTLIANNVYFNNSGGITRTANMTVGSGGSTSSIIEFNNTHGGSCGNFAVAPYSFNIGSGGLTVNYKTEATSRTIGVEMPTTTPNCANIYVSNTNGVINNSNKSLSGDLTIATGGIYDLATFATNRNTSGGNLIVAGTMKLGANTGGQTGSNFPTNFATMTMTGGTVEYNGSSAITQTVYGTPAYNNLTLTNSTGSGTASKNIIANLTKSNFTINSGVQFTIPANLTVSVANNLVNSSGVDGLVLKSTNAGTGSLIAGSISGSGTIERYMSETQWHLVSPPAIEALYGTGNFLPRNLTIPYWSSTPENLGIATYDYSINKWSPYYTQSAGSLETFVSGKGYMVRTVRFGVLGAEPNHDFGPTVLDFKAALATGNKDITIYRTNNFAWNCVGNPFTSAIVLTDGTKGGNLNNFLDINDAKIDAASFGIYILNDSDPLNPKYDIINYGSGQTYASLGQGFFIRANTGLVTSGPGKNDFVTFTKEMQVHELESSTPFKSGQTSCPTIKLIAAFDAAKVSTEIKFIDGTTTGLDKGYDAGLLQYNPSVALYTRLVDDIDANFQLQCLPTKQYNNMIIPVGIDSKTGGDVTFSAVTSNLEAGCKVIFEDRATNKFTDLSTTTYKAAVLANTSTSGRFFIHTSDIVSGLQDQVLPGKLSAYAKGNTEIHLFGEVGNESVATLYDTAGKAVLTKTLNGGNLNIIGLPNLHSGIYLLNINDKGAVQTIKVMIK